MNILKRLKEETRTAHLALEEAMYGDKLRDGSIELSDYERLVLVHFLVVGAIEGAMKEGKWDQKFSGLMYEKRKKLPALQKDMEVLGISSPIKAPKIDFFKRL